MCEQVNRSSWLSRGWSKVYIESEGPDRDYIACATSQHDLPGSPLAVHPTSMQLSRVPLPTPESLAYRSLISRLVSPLRRVRPRVPFYDLAAHRIPTLWTLYRGLMREAPGANVRGIPVLHACLELMEFQDQISSANAFSAE